jgi:hypothetical protein
MAKVREGKRNGTNIYKDTKPKCWFILTIYWQRYLAAGVFLSEVFVSGGNFLRLESGQIDSVYLLYMLSTQPVPLQPPCYTLYLFTQEWGRGSR